MIVTALGGFLAAAAAAAADPAGAAGATRAPARAAVGAVILGAVALVLGEALPGDRSALAAGGTGAALVILGLWATHVALQLHAHGHEEEDAHDHHHGHDHPHDHDHHDHPHGAHDQAHPHHAHAHGHHAHLHTPGAGPAGLRRALAMAPALVLSPRTEAIGWAIGVVIAMLFATAVLARLAARVEAEGGSRVASLRALCGTMGVLSLAVGCLRILSR